jgi:SAM-dependent methyltransferase
VSDTPPPDLSQQDPTGRFTGLADLYASCRPDYPSAALDLIVARGGLDDSTLLADIGCGTGISARLFAERGVPVIGIEPNDEMRVRAAAEPVPPGCPLPVYRPGRAEATGLADGAVAVVLAAQAFHWFDAPLALREFHRILRPGGWVALLGNERDESDPFTAAYGAVVRTSPDAAAVEGPRARAGLALLESPLFGEGQRIAFGHEQILDEEGLLGRSFSASHAPREPERRVAFAADLRAVFARFQRDVCVRLRYETTVYLARRQG